jgi:hypothetical protein
MFRRSEKRLLTEQLRRRGVTVERGTTPGTMKRPASSRTPAADENVTASYDQTAIRKSPGLGFEGGQLAQATSSAMSPAGAVPQDQLRFRRPAAWRVMATVGSVSWRRIRRVTGDADSQPGGHASARPHRPRAGFVGPEPELAVPDQQ